MKIIDSELLNEICKMAKESPRLRMNYNLHSELDDPVQRLMNALEPGTEIPVHRHRHTDETYLVMRGSLFVMLFDKNKKLLNKVLLNPKEGTYGVSVPAGQWHSIEVLESDTVIFEIKEGPYKALTSEDIL